MWELVIYLTFTLFNHSQPLNIAYINCCIYVRICSKQTEFVASENFIEGNVMSPTRRTVLPDFHADSHAYPYLK